MLFHASQQKNLSVIKPQPTKSLNKYIGDYVFASKNKLMALMYLVPVGLPTLMNPEKNHPTIVICDKEANFIKKDRGGAIYELPEDSFFETPQKGLSLYEQVSNKPVKPSGKTIYSSSLEALISAGIKIIFVDDSKFKSLINNPKQREIIQSLKAYNRN